MNTKVFLFDNVILPFHLWPTSQTVVFYFSNIQIEILILFLDNFYLLIFVHMK